MYLTIRDQASLALNIKFVRKFMLILVVRST